jgi:hypothetical protein
VSDSAQAQATEKLVRRLESVLAEKASVQWNQHLPDRTTGDLRQIDVLVTLKDGHHELRIIYEVKAHRRPIGVSFIEALRTKRDDVRADQAALVATNGFTKAAKKKADQHGIPLLTLSDMASDPFPFPWLKVISNITLHARRAILGKWTAYFEDDILKQPEAQFIVKQPFKDLLISSRRRPPQPALQWFDEVALEAMDEKYARGTEIDEELALHVSTLGGTIGTKDGRHQVPLRAIRLYTRMTQRTFQAPSFLRTLRYEKVGNSEVLAEIAAAHFRDADGDYFIVEVIAKRLPDGRLQLFPYAGSTRPNDRMQLTGLDYGPRPIEPED